MKIRRILIIVFFMVLIFPLNNALAYESKKPFIYTNGIFDNPSVISNHNFDAAVKDNNLSTGITMYQKGTPNFKLYYIEFNEPMLIESIYFNILKYGNPNFKFYFNDGSAKDISYSDALVQGSYYEINVKNVTRIEVFAEGANPFVEEVEFFGKSYLNDRDGDGIIDDEDPYPDDPTNTVSPISNAAATASDKDVKITYKLPETNFGRILIEINGQKYETQEGSYTIGGLDTDKSYTATITHIDKQGKSSEPVTVSFRTDKPPEPEVVGPQEVKNLNIQATDERVDLTWDNPNKNFEKAKIYRMNLGGPTALNLNPFAVRSVSAATYKPLFETNGTEFSDLSIEPEHEYEYKVTTVYKGEESQGITVKTAVPKPPLVDLKGIDMPFDVVDLIKSGNGLVLLIGGFVLLGLSFLLVPKLIRMIRGSAQGGTQYGAANAKGTPVMAAEKKQREIRTVRDGRDPKLTKRQRKEITGHG